MCFMDPQKKIWKGDAGHKYKLTSHQLTRSDSCTPFIFNHPCSIKLNASYLGTIIRLPLRDSPSEISSKLYTITKLKSLLSALKRDAEVLLLFLRHVESIKVYTINPRGKVTKIFSVEADTSSVTERREAKNKFFNSVEEYHANSICAVSFPHLQYEVTISVQDLENSADCHWFIMNWVGSPSSEVLEMSNKMLNLPWLGLAVPLTFQISSRLFCFLPMPDSEEVNPPLPVCVHGTFGLTKDRRHLKWKSSDMQNDDGALWNDLLLSKMLPPCYVNCLGILKHKCTPDVFYSFWPDLHVVDKTNWKVLLQPLLTLLVHDEVFWSRNHTWVKLQPSVYVVPELKDNNFSEVIITSLIKCGKVVVELPDRIWEAIKFVCSNNVYPFTIISPYFVRQALQGNSSKYISLSLDEKLDLLQYCLGDNNFDDLYGLKLLPTVDGSFQTFQNSNSKHKVYIYKSHFLNPQLLPDNENDLVNLESENEVLHHKLQLVAERKCTQLRMLTLEAIATMLKNYELFKEGYCPKDSEEFFDDAWLKLFWKWVRNHSLDYFVCIPLVPISNNLMNSRFRIVCLLQKNQSRVIKCSKNDICDCELITAAEKLGCFISFSEDFKYLYHPDLDNYVHSLSLSSFLNISLRPSIKSAKFTSKQGRALRQFIFQQHVELTQEQARMIANLCIFPAVQNDTLYSLASVKTTIRAKTGTIIISQSDFPRDYKQYIPETPVILTCNTVTLTNLQSMLPKISFSFTKAQLILYVMLPAVERQQLSRDDIIKCTAIILKPEEYFSLVNSSEGDDLYDKLQSLKFLPTNRNSSLFSPSQVYDPDDDVVRELFKGQEIYPIDPFVKKYFTVLRELGMKNSDDLNSSDIVKIVKIISKGFSSKPKGETRRANKLLKFLSLTKGSALLSTHHKEESLTQTLCSTHWLPVMVTPPNDYPTCIGWNGATGSQCVPPKDVYAGSSLDDHKKLPYLIGSQVKILQCDVLLSTNLIASLGITQRAQLNAVIQQYLELVSKHTEIETIIFNNCVKFLYEYLQSAVISSPHNESWESLRQSKVVQVRDGKFVKPSIVACSFDDDTVNLGKLEPHLYILPSNLQQYKSFFCHIGVKEEISFWDVLSVLETIACKPNDSDWKLVMRILKWLCNEFELEQVHDRIFVPVSSDSEDKLVLKPANQVAILNTDLKWLIKSKEVLTSITGDYFLVHSSISHDMACSLQLKPLNTIIANTEEFCCEQAGQSEPLTTRLNTILKEYKDTSVIQELLQNADDAGATEVAVYYDIREHDSSNLFFPGMANSYGPALLFYNNAEFTEEDFESIRKIAGETKLNKPLKIGKFGVGFCSVYHITDVPSFVSGENFVVFDPTLQCLEKEIKSEFNPGIKINFHKHYLLNKSNQLIPYEGICGFNPKRHFKGTLFRFPLRTEKSKISKSVYTAGKVESMLDRVKENSSKLLMFLNNVKKVTFWQSEGNRFLKETEVTATKHTVSNNSNITTYKVSVSGSINHEEENWLIGSSSQQLDTNDDKQNYGTASVSIKLDADEQSKKICIESVTGECFCYLPLHMETGLPVHISSNFAVMTNRRSIWKADNAATATKESNWNEMLMSVVLQAYIELLLHLRSMQQNGSLDDYRFHCLWPIKPKEANPWSILIEAFYNTILSSAHPLFYSKITNSWKTLDQCLFLSPKIFPSVNFQKRLYSSINQIFSSREIPLVHLPNEVWEQLSDNNNFIAQVIDEQCFISCFYKDQFLEQISADDKSVIVTASLIACANESHGESLPELIKNTKCIPCCPDGEVFKRPLDMLDPKSQISKLFSRNDHMCPDDRFLKQNGLLYKSLMDLGMMTSLPWDLVVDRAKHMQNVFEDDQKKSLEYLVILLECIKENLYRDSPVSIKSVLKTVPFLPVMKKPKDYPLSTWKGNPNTLLCGPKLTKPTSKYDTNSVNPVYVCGSQISILDADAIPFTLLTDKVTKFLGITKDLRESDVISHFSMLIHRFNNGSHIQSNVLPMINCTVKEVYKYWVSKINQGHTLKETVSRIKDKACIWNDTVKKFLHPSCIAKDWKMEGPFLFKVPSMIPSSLIDSFMNKLGVRRDFPIEVMLNALLEMKSQYKNQVLPTDCQDIVQLILPKLRKNSSIVSEKKIFLPDEKFILRDVKNLKYNDAPWCTPEENFIYCHGSIERGLAIHLGVTPVKNAILEVLDVTDEWFEDFGQEEKLTIRLGNILRDYPRDITFLKEMLQNADDAGATKLYVILDKRYHSKEKVASEEWKQLQGPAILIWNNSTFSKDDLIGIQRIGLGSKRDDADKIGQYGIGYNVVYHFTDCPSFITDEKLCIFDPHYRYIVDDKRKKPGRMYKDLNTLWSKFPDMKSPYLQNDLDNFPNEMKMPGSLFRFPLRLTEDMAKQSEIVNIAINLQELECDMKTWVSQVVEALLFLRNINDVKLFIVDDTSPQVFRKRIPNPVQLCFHASSKKGQEKVIATSGNAKLVMFPMTLAVSPQTSVNSKIKERWLVQLGEGNVEDGEIDWNEIKLVRGILPRHGIAAPIDSNGFEGKSFCFLPLPTKTNLPVHIHGQFVLHSDRRGIWFNSSGSSSDLTTSDPRTIWNFRLSCAISAAYAHFLIDYVEHKEMPSTRDDLDKLLQNYYSFFPNPNVSEKILWLHIVNKVYTILSQHEASVLATIVKCNNSTRSSSGSEKFVIKWYKLHKPGMIDEPHFYSKKDPLRNVLKLIGMNITDTPIEICEWFNNIDQEGLPKLPMISRKSVIEYYIKYSFQILNRKLLPCSLSSTKFCKISSFITFLRYFMTSECKFSEEAEASTNIFSVGLIVTADEMLHSLSDGKTIISSPHWKLFPNSKEYFIHDNLQKFYPFHSKYLMNYIQNRFNQFSHISSIIGRNIPFKWNGETQALYSENDTDWIQNILYCIAHDPAFSEHSNEILQKIPLFPADNGMVYSTTSHVLSLKHAIGDDDIPHYDIDSTKRLMRKLKIPLLRHDLLNDILDKIKAQIPSIFIPDNILKALHLMKTGTLFSTLSNNEFKLLFRILKLVSYSNSINQQHIKQFPIFSTVDNRLVSLTSASEVWIWNNIEVCNAGMSQWVDHIPDSIVFLDPSAPWAVLENEAENLKMRKINKYDVYCKFIFPNFHHLDSSARMKHLTFIVESVYPNCKHALKFLNSDIDKVKIFISTLQSLRCIPDNTGVLQTIRYFYDHEEPLFKAFCNESCFLPRNFRNAKWYECFKYFGLKVNPTAEEFISYCKQLVNFDTISAIQTGSELLLKVLFDSSIKKYQDICSHQCLQEVSQIPIAIVEKLPHLDSLKEQKMGELTINCKSSSITLTKLHGSSLMSNSCLVWTVLPLIKNPNCRWTSSTACYERLQHLGIVQSPAVEDVLSNMYNISTSVFAKFDRFERCSTVPSASNSSSLPGVVVTIIQYLQTLLKQEHEFENLCQQLEPQLSSLRFLPVKLPIQNAEEYALVKPTQVLCMDPSEVSPYYPFLHPLIDEASGFYKFLSKFGVKRSISFCHVQLVLQSAKDLCQDGEVDLNIKCIVLKITQELIKLLKQTDDKRSAACDLKPLYLLSQDNVLTESSKLVVNDINSHRILLPAGYAYLNFLIKDSEQQGITELPYLLPEELKLKRLKSIIMYELIDGIPAEDVFPNVSVIKDILVSCEFKRAIEIFATCCNQGVLPESVVNALITFQSSLVVQYLVKVQAKPKLKVDGKVIQINDIVPFSYFLDKSNQQWVLSLKNTHDKYPHSVFLNLARKLYSDLHLCTSHFGVTDNNELPEPHEYICQLLQCNSVSKIPEVIKMYLPVDPTDLEMDSSIERDPVLGDPIPTRFHHNLDQSLFNFFYPEEWIGYEIEEEKIVYAQILCEVIHKNVSHKSNPRLMMERKYVISIGLNEANIEVSVVDLFKFIHDKSTETSYGITEMEVYDGPSTSEHASKQSIKTDSEKKKTKSFDRKSIREAIKAAWALPAEQRRKAIKRLYLQYHPDKNHDNPNATKEFQFLQQEIERLEKGISEDEADGRGTAFSSSQTSDSTWQHQFYQWNRTASSHSHFRSRGYGTSFGYGMPGGQNIPRSQPDLNEAKLWIGQAKYDYSALCVLKNASFTNNGVSAATCFMCHEVAEKSLKAGLYATSGMSKVSLKNHNLMLSASALIQMGCPVKIDDAQFLERFYLDTRFPNCYTPHAIPGEKFSSDTAKQGFEAATRIYETVKQMI